MRKYAEKFQHVRNYAEKYRYAEFCGKMRIAFAKNGEHMRELCAKKCGGTLPYVMNEGVQKVVQNGHIDGTFKAPRGWLGCP